MVSDVVNVVVVNVVINVLIDFSDVHNVVVAVVGVVQVKTLPLTAKALLQTWNGRDGVAIESVSDVVVVIFVVVIEIEFDAAGG